VPSSSGLSSLREIPLGLFDLEGEGTTILLCVGNDSSDNTASLISNFHHILNVVWFFLANSLTSEVDMLTFRNTLSVPSS